MINKIKGIGLHQDIYPPFNKDDLKSILRKKTKGHFSMAFSFKNINR